MRFFKAFMLASAVLVLGGQSACGDSGERVEQGLTPDQLLSKWKGENQGQKTGQPATLDVTGNPLVLTPASLTSGTPGGTTELAAPLTLSVGPLFPKDNPYVFFENAQVGAQKGLLVLEGTRLSFTAGTWGRVEVSEALARTHRKDGSAAPLVLLGLRNESGVNDPEVTFPQDWSEAKRALFFADPVAIHPSGMTLSGFTRGVLVTDSGATAISGSVTVQSATRMFWADTSRVETSSSLVDCPRFALGGATKGGALVAAGASVSPPPGAIMGEGARVRLEPGRVRSEGSFQLTQALTESGPVVPAEVQMAFDPKPLTVKPSGRELVTVVYREKSLRGDAMLADIQVTGSGKEAVVVAIDQPEAFLQGFWDLTGTILKDFGPVGPLYAAPILIASPFIALGDALGCLFTTCPQAYPSWMKAGSAGRFHIIVRGTLPPGKYSADVTMTGRNYAPFTIPVQFTISE